MITDVIHFSSTAAEMRAFLIVAFFVAAGKFSALLIIVPPLAQIIFLLFAVFFSNTAMASPLPSDEDWHLVPNTEGRMHLVDINLPPQDVESLFVPATDIVFTLFTNLNPNAPHRIFLNDPFSLAASHFNPAHPTRFLIHGWNGDSTSGMNTQVRPIFLNHGNFNVIIVDWGAGAQTINYAVAAGNTGPSGTVVGQFIAFLNLHTGVPFPSISVIGFSLGAHVAGFAGKYLTGRLGSVVALDAAFPLFNINNPAGRVASTDAIYVESIHTDSGRLGFNEPIGQAAFYPNWGFLQNGCGVDPVGACGHDRAWQFYGESITNPQAFYGTLCAGWPSIPSQSCPSTGPSMAMGGEPVNNGASGVFYLTTNAAAPFGQGWRA